MRLDNVSFFAGFSLLAGPWLFAQGFRDLRVKRLIQNTPTARIRSMAMGLVEISGTVEPRSILTAPFSARPCAYWELDISTRGRNNSWSVVHRESSGHPFVLRDETGSALIYPKGARCTLNFGVSEECIGINVPEPYSSYMKTLGPRHLLWQMGSMRFRERMLDAGQSIYVLGTATPRSRVLSIAEGDEFAATGTDGGGAQHVRAVKDDAVAIVRQGEGESTFIISEQSERMLTFQLGTQALLKLVGGPIATLFGLGYWLYALKAG
jgi:hypothetical protein